MLKKVLLMTTCCFLLSNYTFAEKRFARRQLIREVGCHYLPDYTKWELSDWHVNQVLYKGDDAYILDEHYEDRNSTRLVGVFYKPISREVYEKLDSLTGDEQDRQVHALAGKTPLFLFYCENVDCDPTHIYGKEVRWFEFYRFGRSRWRFLIKNTPENSVEADRLIERKYEIKF